MQEPKPLYNQIDEALATSQFDKQSLKFLPDGVIDSLITQQTIMWAFKRKNFPKDDISKALALANSILEEKFKKVFATAVIIGLTGNDLQQGMQKFKDAGISDDTLPINQGDLSRKGVISPPKIKDTISIGNVKGLNDNKGVENRGVDYWNRPDEDETDEDDSGEIWTSVRASNFCEKQWLFLSPVFSTSKFIHEFTQMCIMPFTKKYLECDSGTFGQVTKYEIHESHLIDPDNSGFRCPEFVAVKELAVKNKEDRQNIFNTWGKEAKALQKMNSLKQPHIVWFYTAFQRGIPGGQDHYLMLEWASGGNLRNFWKSFKRPALTSKLIRATVHQLLGLVKAINKAHYPETGPNFRHGDLKPENILWFKDESGHGIGTFKIGDWGLAKQHFRVTEMRSRRTTTKWGTRRYEPPEEADSQGANLLASDQLGKRRSRLYDIWALGCITLEFVIWLMYGPDELDRFNRGLEVNNSDNSRFYLIKPVTGGRPEAKVHDVAIEWMKHMARDPICTPGSTALGNLLELIETRLLVVQLPKRLGTFIDLSHDSKPPESDTAILSNSSSFQQADPIASPLGSHSLPDIVINDPELRKALTGRNTPIQPRPRAPGRERARADELLDQMLIISGEDEEQSYWFTDVPKPPRGPNVDGIRQRLEYLPVGSLSLGGTERVSSHSKSPMNGTFYSTIISRNMCSLPSTQSRCHYPTFHCLPSYATHVENCRNAFGSHFSTSFTARRT
ncbi:kinase-like domain-containing protein [Xylaria longipes]|nr:kinase-like domain-containing protein [Xylaria longipes]